MCSSVKDSGVCVQSYIGEGEGREGGRETKSSEDEREEEEGGGYREEGVEEGRRK